jgi:hypothetical protein
VPSPAGATTRLYYATLRSTGNGVLESQVFRLDDAHTGDPVPRDVTGPGFPQGAYVSCIAADPSDPDRLLVVFSNYTVRSLFFSADGGATWSAVGGNLEGRPDGTGDGPSVRWAEIVPRADATVYFVGTSTGLYATTQLAGDATAWAQEGAATIGNVVVDMIDARPLDGFVAAGTHGRGVFSAVVDAQVGAEPEPEVPAGLTLSPAYPNPFRTETRLTFSVARSQAVRAEVFDQAGRRVALLFDGRLPAGTPAALTFDAAGRASGIYFVRLTGEDFSATRRVVLVK